MLKGKSILTTILLLMMFLAGFSMPGFAQVGKVGYIDSDRIFAEYEDWGKAQEEFNTLYKAWDDEAKEMQKAYEEMVTEYEKQKLILSPEKKKEREAAIDVKRQNLDSFTKDVFGPNGKAERKQSELVKPLLDKINTAIERVATEGNYDLVFNSGGLAYAKQDFDITDKVLEILAEE